MDTYKCATNELTCNINAIVLESLRRKSVVLVNPSSNFESTFSYDFTTRFSHRLFGHFDWNLKGNKASIMNNREINLH